MARITSSNFSLVQFSGSVMSGSLQPHVLQHTRLPCSSPTPRACSNSFHQVGDAIQLCHPLLTHSPPPLQSFPALGSFPMSQFFTICSDFGAQENKVCFHCFPIYLPWSDGTGCHDFSVLNVCFHHFTAEQSEVHWKSYLWCFGVTWASFTKQRQQIPRFPEDFFFIFFRLPSPISPT